MQASPSIVDTHSNCYLQINRNKQTVFTDVAETTTILELKQHLACLLHLNPDTIRLIRKDQVLDLDDNHLLNYGITSKTAVPQDPFELRLSLPSDNESPSEDTGMNEE